MTAQTLTDASPERAERAERRTRERTVKLKVRATDPDDINKDIVRVAERRRAGLKIGRIHKFTVGDQSAYFILRSCAPEDAGKIFMDEAAREKLGLSAGADKEFKIERASLWGEICWLWNATDPTYRIAAKLGVLSLGLGIIALVPTVLSIISFVMKLSPHTAAASLSMGP